MAVNAGFAVLLTLCLFVGVSACSTYAPKNDQTTAQQMAGQEDDPRMKHLHVLQAIAQENGGNRAVGTKGGLLTAKYIDAYIRELGLKPSQLVFENRNKVVGQNLVVEIEGQSKDTAIIVGGHYDSVKMGPGINDNGSGVAVLLELIKYYTAQNEKPKHTIYFAFWDSEEDGIGGSSYFVEHLSAKQLNGIQAYINLDMVGTQNPTVQIADGDQSSIDNMEKMLKARGMAASEYKPLIESLRSIPSHQGDLVLENHLKAFFSARGMDAKEDVSTLTASDTAPFLGKVPVASIILFNEQMKGDELEFAPCYHKACDTIESIDPKSMQMAAEAVQYLIQVLNK